MIKYVNKVIGFALVLLLSSCAGVSRLANHPRETVDVRGEVIINGLGASGMSMSLRSQTVCDSMTVISLMPVWGLEMMRLEATPDSVWVIDKLTKRYAATDYASLRKQFKLPLSYSTVQRYATGKVSRHVQKDVTVLGQKLHAEIIINQVDRQVPVRVMGIDKSRYTLCNISDFLLQH